jgi:hypothetical protein
MSAPQALFFCAEENNDVYDARCDDTDDVELYNQSMKPDAA